MRRLFALILSMLLIVLVAPLASAAVEATYSGGGKSGTSVTMNRGSGDQSLGTKLFDLKVTGQGTLPAYCIDIQTNIRQTTYVEEGWNTIGEAAGAKILWILKNSYPTKTVDQVAAAVGTGASGLTTEEAIGATQAAIWTFSDGATYVDGANTKVNAVVAYLTGTKNAGLSTPPAPSLSLTPGEATGPVGSRVGPFRLTVSDGGSADLSLLPNVAGLEVYAQASGGSPVTSATSGANLWVRVPAGTTPGQVTLQATSKTTVFAGRLFVKKSGDPSQKLILAQDTDATSTATANASWTKAPAKPSATIDADCVPSGGAAGTVTLENQAVLPGDSVEFTVRVPGRNDEKVTVAAGQTRTVDFILPEDATENTVEVTAPGMEKVSETVTTDCRISDPKATISARCEPAPEGGATVTIDLSNPVEDGNSQTAVSTTFTVFVGGARQTIGGKDSWTVAPKETLPLTLTLPEGTKDATVVVKADDKQVAEKTVTTDCAIGAEPKATVAGKCLPQGGADVSIDLSNDPKLGQGQTSVPVTFTVLVDGKPQVIDGATSWAVAPGDKKQLTFTLPEDSGSPVISVVADERTIATQTVSTDCTVPATPQSTVQSACLVQPGGGAQVSVVLANTATPAEGKTALDASFTIEVDGTPQVIDGATSWTVAAGKKQELVFTVPEDSGNRTVVVKSGGAQVSQQVVSTDCQGIVVDAAGICRADTPFYSVNVESQNLPALDPATNKPYQVKVEWLQADASGALVLKDGKPVAAFDPATNQPYVDTYMLDNGKLATGELLWKGAKVDAQGKPIDWPGWDQRADGTWVEVPDGGVRPAAILRVSVNPTLDTVALYPPATPGCNANPPANVSGVEDEVDTPDVPEAVEETDEAVVAGSEDELAKTGGDLGPVLALSLMALVSGAVLFGTGRLAKR